MAFSADATHLTSSSVKGGGSGSTILKTGDSILFTTFFLCRDPEDGRRPSDGMDGEMAPADCGLLLMVVLIFSVGVLPSTSAKPASRSSVARAGKDLIHPADLGRELGCERIFFSSGSLSKRSSKLFGQFSLTKV